MSFKTHILIEIQIFLVLMLFPRKLSIVLPDFAI